MPLITGHFLKMHFHAVGPTQNSKHSQKLSHNCLQYIIIALLEALEPIIGKHLVVRMSTWSKTSDYNLSRCCSVAKLCPTLCDPMDCSRSGLPVLHYLLEFVQTYVHWVSDAIQPSHCLPPPSPLSLNLSQHQSLFQFKVSSLHQVAKILEPWFQHQSFKWVSNEGWFFFRFYWFDLLAVQRTLKSLLQPQFKSINSLALSLLYGPSLTTVHDYLKNHSFDYTDFCQQSDASAF